MSIEVALDPVRQQKAREYNKLWQRVLFVELGVSAVLLLVLLFTGASAELAGILAFPLPWAAALYLLALALGYGVIMAPLEYYQSFVLPHRYGLSTQSLTGWLKDEAKSSALELLLGLCLVVGIYWLMDNVAAFWWLVAALIVVLLSLFLSWLTPIVLIPLFFKLKPLGDGELRGKLMDLASRAGASINEVFTMDLSSKATTANAMLAGLGKSRRVIISDTLLQGYSWEEVEVTLAHELGHHLHRDIPKLVAIQALVFLLAFYLADLALKAGVAWFSFRGITDLAALPWLILVLAVCILTLHPLLNWYRRRVELAADKKALELSNNPGAFIALMAKLTDQNLQEAEPGRWTKLLFYDHPTYNERVKLDNSYIVIASQAKQSREASS